MRTWGEEGTVRAAVLWHLLIEDQRWSAAARESLPIGAAERSSSDTSSAVHIRTLRAPPLIGTRLDDFNVMAMTVCFGQPADWSLASASGYNATYPILWTGMDRMAGKNLLNKQLIDKIGKKIAGSSVAKSVKEEGQKAVVEQVIKTAVVGLAAVPVVVAKSRRNPRQRSEAVYRILHKLRLRWKTRALTRSVSA
jgi:hypothetical protein